MAPASFPMPSRTTQLLGISHVAKILDRMGRSWSDS